MPPRTELSDLIQLERVRIVEELDDAYRVEYGPDEYTIEKASQSHWAEASSSSGGMRLEMREELRLVPEHGIFQDEQAPAEFKEVMIFHEIREQEYSKAGFDDAHQRAMNDEVLYVLKYFSPEKQKDYLNFAADYRQGEVAQKEDIKNLEESIRLSGQSYAMAGYIQKIGEKWSIGTFARHKNALEKLLSESLPKESLLAVKIGMYWPDEGFNLYSELLIKTVAGDAYASSNAGIEWKDERFNPYAELFAKKVAENALRSYFAGMKWKDERFNPFAEIFVKKIARDVYKSSWVGHYWKDERFNPFAEILAKTVAGNVITSIQAGKLWKDERFNPYAELFANIVKSSPEYLAKALTVWPEERKKLLK